MQWRTLFHKEVLENWRNKKWIWVPLVMILFSIMDPLTIFRSTEMMESIGDVPEGMVFEMPSIEPIPALMMSLESLSTYGAIIITLVSMGTIAGERQQGITEMIFAKPIKFSNYITAKWVSYTLLSILSLVISLCMSWYYINLLFGSISFYSFILAISFYSLWFIFIVTLSIFYNTICKNAGLVLACTIGTLFILSGINTIVGHKFTWFPNQLSTHIEAILMTTDISIDIVETAGVIIILIALLLFVSIQICQRREMI